MSYAAVLAVWPGERYSNLMRLQNSWGFAPPIWDTLVRKYLGWQSAWDFREPDGGLDRLWRGFQKAMPDMEECERAVLRMTYDYYVVYREHYALAYKHLHEFYQLHPPEGDVVYHLMKIAGVFSRNPDCPAIGFYGSSVNRCLFDPHFKVDENGEEIETDPEWDKLESVYE